MSQVILFSALSLFFFSLRPELVKGQEFNDVIINDKPYQMAIQAVTRWNEKPFKYIHSFKTSRNPDSKKDEFLGFADEDKSHAWWRGVCLTVQKEETFSFSFYCDAESRFGEKDKATGMSIHYGTERIALNAEYIDVVLQEGDDIYNTEWRDSTWLGAVSYRIKGPLLLAIRYESFHDNAADKVNILDGRVSIGGHITLFEKGAFYTRLMAEYRKNSFEKTTAHSSHDNKSEFFTRLAIKF
jgi:hypothetical protein